MKITIRRVKANQLYTFISCCHLHELPLISFWFDSDFSRSVIQFKFRAEKFTFKQRTIQTPFASLTSILAGSYAYYCNFVLFYILSVFFFFCVFCTRRSYDLEWIFKKKMMAKWNVSKHVFAWVRARRPSTICLIIQVSRQILLIFHRQNHLKCTHFCDWRGISLGNDGDFKCFTMGNFVI